MEQAKKVKQIFADILDVKEEAITEAFGPNDADMWDSMNNLRLITALEEEFNIQLTRFAQEVPEWLEDFDCV